MRVLMTGVDGFIGGNLFPECIERGYDVIGTVEPSSSCANKAKFMKVDISSGDGLLEAFSGADIVIHLAARNHVLKETERDPLSAYRRINVEGTRNVVRAARKQGVGLFVHFSSVKAMGEEAGRILDETSSCLPSTPYGISKLESEEIVRSEVDGTEMAVVIVRLPMVYGPGNKGNLPRMIRWADRGYPFPVLHPDNFRSMVYVGNVVAGIMAVLKASPQGVATYILKDREDYSTRRIYGAICNSLGKKPRLFPIPTLAVRAAEWLSEDFRKISGSFRVCSAKFEREIHFIPPFSLEEGIGRTVEWYRHSVR
jgi:nucleoside-diphosphate-sugar epimerase